MDPLKELQGAVYSRLTTYAGVTALVGTRVYDRVPSDAALPYISFGPVTATSDDADCIDGLSISMQIDVWSTEPGYVEAQAIAGAVRAALGGDDLTLVSNALVTIEHRQTRLMRDPDGLTSHAAISFDAFVEAT
jgi:hypothetical protein